MQLISMDVPAAAIAAPGSCSAEEALAGVVATIGASDFGRFALAELNRWIPLCWMSIYSLFDHQPPEIHAAGSFRVVDGTKHSWRAYRSSLYRSDETFVAARERVRPGQGLLVHWNAREIPLPHREQIYSRHGLRERLSVVSTEADGGLLAINLYRHETQDAFSDGEIDAIGKAAPLLRACVRRHLASSPSSELMAGLTQRQRDVCMRMLKGWTHEGIAADLGVSSATVKTYRDRAFERLGIHHRNELFALMAGQLDRKS